MNHFVYQIVEQIGLGCDGGTKPVRDIAAILRSERVQTIPIRRFSSKNSLLQNFFRLWWILQSFYYSTKFKHGSVVFLQFPGQFFTGRLGFWLVNERLIQRKKLKLVTIVHDLNSQRFQETWKSGHLSSLEQRLFAMSSRLIVHCDEMRNFLSARGVSAAKMVTLGIFDYLNDDERAIAPSEAPEVAIAGNLTPTMCAFLPKLKEISDVRWCLYGAGYDAKSTAGDNVTYGGCFTAEELPNQVKARYGLAWYGDSVDEVTGPIGKYLSIIFVHKLSFYITIGLPVIVWRKSAMAPFVERMGIGLVVDNLRELGEKIRAVSAADYTRMRETELALSKTLREGQHMRNAYWRVMESLSGELTS